MINILDVIWIHDDCIRPPGPKMVACVEPNLGFFFRINSNPYHQTPVLLKRADHSFLNHDSYLECGTPLELDEYIVSESIRTRGIIGCLDAQHIRNIIAAVKDEQLLSPTDRLTLVAALESVIPS